MSITRPGEASRRARSALAIGHSLAAVFTAPRRVAAMLIAMLMVFVAAAPVSADLPVGSDQDVQAPVVTGFSLDQTSVDVTTNPATITANITVSDDISGLAQVVVRYVSPSGQNLVFSFPVSGSLGGTFTSSAVVDTYRESGTWALSSVLATDQVGNAASYGPADNLGPSSIQVTSNGDNVKPTVSAIRFLTNPVEVSATTQTVLAEIDAADLGTGVTQLSMWVRSPSNTQGARLFASSVDRVAGDAESGTYRAAFQVTGTSMPNGGTAWTPGLPRNSESGAWTIGFVQVYDRAGNSGVVSGAAADAVSDGPLMVMSDPADVTDPALTSFDFSPNAIDVTSGPATLNLSFTVSDDLAGVREAWLEFRSPLNTSLSPAWVSRYGGSRYPLSSPKLLGGTLSGSLTFPQFDRAGTWNVQQVCVSDWVGHQACTLGAALDALGPTSLVVTDANQEPADTDGDGVPDDTDNCVDTVNPDQLDLDNDGLGDACDDTIVTVSISDVTVEENPPPNGYGQLIFTFSQPLPATACFRFRDIAGSATEPADYFVNNGRVCFGVGTENAGTGVAIYDDGLTEGPETFQIELYDLEGVAPGTTLATWTITDPAPADTDGDGVPDDTDNCVDTVNPDQLDLDNDGLGDACDDDIDGDGLSNVIEIWLGCNPHDPDSDGDGVWDLVEILVGSNPLLGDTDDDGEGDGGWLLRIYGSLCGCGLGDDSNGNGVWDLVEFHYFGSLYDVDLHGGGGFGSLTEYLFHRCGCSPDELDGDGIPRIVRHLWGSGGLTSYIVRCGCHPWEDLDGGGGIRVEFLSLLGGGLDEDPDGDGIITVIEILLGCNPNLADTDGDGLSDYDEVFVYGTSVNDADTDGDGMVDGVEIALGCDPHDPDSDGDGVLDGADSAPLAYVHECRIDVTGPISVGTPLEGTIDVRGHVTGARIRWGDGGVELLAGPGTASFGYAYDAAGVYLVDCEVTDTTDGTQTSEAGYVVVYDPSAGFVTGGGWIDSPAGAFLPNPDAAGPARFGFVSQYKKGATVPTGSTQFQFQAGDLNLHSNAFDWLVVSGARAQFRGTGSVNGVDGYRFTVTVIDGDQIGRGQNDRFRMRIWAPAGGLVYDNQMGAAGGDDPTTAITQGSIVIHNKRNK